MAEKRRVLRGCLIAVGAAILLSPLLFLGAYRIAAKKALSGPLLRNEINKIPKDLLIEWDEAQSTWPGRASVKNLTIRGSDPNVQWIIVVPEATFSFELLPFLRRQFVVSELRPASIQFRIRQKLPPGPVDEETLRYLPEIPGFTGPPLKVEGEKLPAPDPKAFTIVVKDVATDHFDDIWFDTIRYRGPGTLRGSFRLKPGIRAQIGPASVQFGGGVLSLRDRPAVSKLDGRIDATFDDWNVQELLEGAKVFRVVTAKATLEGPTEGVDFLDSILNLGKGVHVSGGPGQLKVAATIDHGMTAVDASITAKAGKYVRPGLSLVGDVDAQLKVGKFDIDGGTPEIGGSAVKISDVVVAGASKGTKGWWGRFEIPSGRLSGGLSGRVAFQCKDLRPLLAFLGSGLPKWTASLIDLENLKASANVVFSEPRTTIRGLRAEAEKLTVDGEYDRRGEASRGAFLIRSGILIVGVELDNQKTIVRPLLAKQWYAKIQEQGLPAPSPPPPPKEKTGAASKSKPASGAGKPAAKPKK